MDEARLKELLLRVQSGGMQVDDAVDELRQLPFADLGFAGAALAAARILRVRKKKG